MISNNACAVEIVKTCFGSYFGGSIDDNFAFGPYTIETMFWVTACDLDQHEPRVRAALDLIDWQLIPRHYLDPTRMKWVPGMRAPAFNPDQNYNEFYLDPIRHVRPRPVTVFHATPTETAAKCREEGIKLSSSRQFEDAYGKIHVTVTHDDATAMATKIAEARGHDVSDYSILEAHIDTLEEARIYVDVYSDRGLVIDRVPCIPPQNIVRELQAIRQPKIETEQP